MFQFRISNHFNFSSLVLYNLFWSCICITPNSWYFRPCDNMRSYPALNWSSKLYHFALSILIVFRSQISKFWMGSDFYKILCEIGHHWGYRSCQSETYAAYLSCYTSVMYYSLFFLAASPRSAGNLCLSLSKNQYCKMQLSHGRSWKIKLRMRQRQLRHIWDG